MTYTLLLLASLIGSPTADQNDLQFEKARVTVLMWMLAPGGHVTPQPDKPDDNQDGDETHQYCEKCHGTKKVKSGDGIIDIPCPCGKYCHCKKPDNPSPNPDPSPGPSPNNGVCGPHCRCQQPCTCGPGCRCDHCPVGRHNNRHHSNQIAMVPVAPLSAVAMACAEEPASAVEDVNPPIRQMLIVGGTWCKPCEPVKAAAHILEAGGWNCSTRDTQALIAVLDFDEHLTGMLKGYRIESLPTLIILNNGKEEKRLVGKDDIPSDPYELANLLLGDADQLTYRTPRGKAITQKRQKNPKPAQAQPLTKPVQNVTVTVQQPTYYWPQYYPAQQGRWQYR